MSALVVRLQTEALDELRANAVKLGKEQDFSLVAAHAAANLVRAHLFNLDERSPRSHFYSKAAKSVEEPRAEGGGASFTINKVGLAQRWLGGTITAGKGTSSTGTGLTKYLAIGTDEVEDQTPWEVSREQDVAFVPRRGGKAMLVQGMRTISTRGKNRGQEVIRAVPGGLVLFWLTTSVTQKPDESVMPSDADMKAEAREAGDNYLSRLLATGGKN